MRTIGALWPPRLGVALGLAFALAAWTTLAVRSAAAVLSASPTWTQLDSTPQWGGYLQGEGAAYDSANDTMILFGGCCVQNETLSVSGSGVWSALNPATSPPARQDMDMTFDPATGTAVLFGGGANGSVFGDTWTWNGTNWTQRFPATSPTGRTTHNMMAYDAERRNVVIFGGCGDFYCSTILGDTWTWDGPTWTEQHPPTSPPPRADGDLAYDPTTRTVVLFGGSTSPDLPNDTWTWDGRTWTQQHPATSPPGRAANPMAYDQRTWTIVMFGGWPNFGDTWTWDGTNWTHQFPTTSPPADWGGVMVTDMRTGFPVFADTYGNTWIWR